jgi:hypothetical protein
MQPIRHHPDDAGLVVLPGPQEVVPVAVIPQWITKRRVEARRERPGNRQGTSGSAQPHGLRNATETVRLWTGSGQN